jgi:hypothetical protein
MELVRILTRSLIGSSYTLALVIDEGVLCLSFHLEDEEQLVPYGYIGRSQEGSPEQVNVQEKNVRRIFGG